MTRLLKTVLRALAAALALAAAHGVAAQTPIAPAEPPEDVLSVQGARPPDGVVPLRYDITVTPDAATMTNQGTVVIDIQVERPVRTITLNALRLSFGAIGLEDGNSARATVDPKAQIATFTFAREIRPGRHQLSIAFASSIATTPYGLFAVDYRDPEGRPARLLATQFESTAAHRFIPCWDNPAAKAVFALHVTAPGDRMVVSNTQALHTTRLEDGRQKVDFAATPKMSPYLLFLSIGDYQRIHRAVDGVDVGVILLRGKAEEGRFALDAAADILRYYDSYFGIRYPLPKMDMVGAPVDGGGFSAMENWGALFYMEQALAIGPNDATDARRQYVFNVVAHEMAHQWFGDLVTMRDWNELWLNEGFANWMAVKAADVLHPDWQAWTQDLAIREAAMDLDARASAPPIVTPLGSNITTPDTITYDKGEYVVRTLEAYLGEDGFRDGVRLYMRQHQYDNTTSDDLWAALRTASGVDVAAMAHSFTDQPGIPLIEAETTAGGLRLVQSRFGLDDRSRALETWLAPIAITPFAGPAAREPLVSAALPLDLNIAPGVAEVLNAGQKTYLRVDYDPASFAALRQAFAGLSPIDQLGVLNDQWALAVAGYRPMSQYLSLLRRIPPADSPLVWARVISKLVSLDALYTDGPERSAYHAAVMVMVQPVSARLESAPGGPDSVDVATLRGELIVLASRFAGAQPRALVRPRDRDQRLAMINLWAAGG